MRLQVRGLNQKVHFEDKIDVAAEPVTTKELHTPRVPTKNILSPKMILFVMSSDDEKRSIDCNVKHQRFQRLIKNNSPAKHTAFFSSRIFSKADVINVINNSCLVMIEINDNNFLTRVLSRKDKERIGNFFNRS